MLVALMAFLSGAVTGALIVSLYSARTPTLSLVSGGEPAFRGLTVKPPVPIQKAEAESEKLKAFVPTAETRRQRRLLEDSPVGALRREDAAP